MNDIKRYDMEEEYHGWDHLTAMRENPLGEYILFEDYEVILARLHAAFHSAIDSPKGTVPAGYEDLYDPQFHKPDKSRGWSDCINKNPGSGPGDNVYVYG